MSDKEVKERKKRLRREIADENREDRRMGELIDGLLMLSRVTGRELDARAVDLSGMAQEIADRLRQTQTERESMSRPSISSPMR